MFFKKKKKEEVHKDDLLLAKGIYLKQPDMKHGNIILNCFLRSMIVFLLVFGSLGGFLSAFEISYNYVMVIVAYLLLSMYFSFLYSTPKFVYRDIGYILFFGVFILAIYFFRIYANSGLYAIINTVLERAQAFFNLSGVRKYETQIDNDYITIAFLAIFIGMVIIIILNIWLYSVMSLFWTVLLTFPLLLIPLYMKLTPDPLYMILLGTGYIAVVIFKANGHYLAFAWDTPFKIKGMKKDRVEYTQDAGVFRQILLSMALLGFCVVVLLNTFVSPAAFEARFKNDRLRDKTADAVGNFLLLGFGGLYNRYSATGGLSGGKLGGISNVRPDYLTDLVVSYTPYGNEAVYLKGYTGGLYRDSQWLSLYDDTGDLGGEDIAIFEEESMKNEAEQLSSRKNEYYAAGRMDVKNVGADTAYLYYPYYTLFEDYSIYNNHNLLSSVQGIGIQQEVSYYYYPKIVWEDQYGEIEPAKINVEGINPDFLDVPEKNRTVIKNECEKIGLNDSMTENEIVDAVKQYFEENIPYTLKPGATPRDEDFINYFLTNNRKGYCAHFASAATLIFRQMGIPARYVEGYAFNLETVLASEINNDKNKVNYYYGYSEIGDSPVMDVEVTDAMAHAWVEIYVEGFGWKTVEVTPGSNEVTDEDNFWDAFSEMLNNLGDQEGNGTGGNRFGDLNLKQYAWLLNVVLYVMSAFLIYVIGKLGIRKVRRYRKCHQKNEREAMIACYADVCDRIRLCDSVFNCCRSHREQLCYIREHYLPDIDVEQFCEELERMSFSNGSVSEQEKKEIYELIRSLRKQIWKQAGMKKKLALWKR
ncbi:MAG: transglutaminase domain-containing protein [Lachnospiraceae bacterium]